MANFERDLYQLFENMKRQIAAQPLNLGGITGGLADTGGRPAGFVGQLPQSRVTFDEDELSEWEIPFSGIPLPSGQSLVTNLNRIRYRIGVLEDAITSSGNPNAFVGLLDTPDDYTGQQGNYVVVRNDELGLEFISPPPAGIEYVSIEEDGTPVGNATTLNFAGDVSVVDEGGGVLTVTITGGGPPGSGLLYIPVSEDESLVVNATAFGFSGNVEVTDGGDGLAEVFIPFPPSGEPQGPISFLDLTDTPEDYTGQEHKVVKVNGDGTGLEFGEVIIPSGEPIPSAFLDLTDTPNTYESHGGKLVQVTMGEDGLEFVDLVIPSGEGLTELPISEEGEHVVDALTLNFTGNVEVIDVGGGAATIHIPPMSGEVITPSGLLLVGSTPETLVSTKELIFTSQSLDFSVPDRVTISRLSQFYSNNGEPVNPAFLVPTLVNINGPVVVESELIGEDQVLTIALDEHVKHTYNEVPLGSGNLFETSLLFIPDTLRVYYNGLRQSAIYFSGVPQEGRFITSFFVGIGDEILVDYDYYESTQTPVYPTGVGYGWIPWGGEWGG